MSNLIDPTAPPPPEPAHNPHLTPQFCFNTTALRDFLRLSRSTVDDSVSLHLNALLTPSRTPFLPTSTSSRPATSGLNRRQLPAATCRTFKQQILFPSWQARDDIFTYCSSVAEKPESLPPSSQLPTPSPYGSSTTGAPPAQADDASPSSTARHTRNYWNQDQVVDERLDPYSGRDYSYTREGKAQILKDVLSSEQGVERIVRSRTWSLLGERCPEEGGESHGTGSSGGWEAEMLKWRRG